jgi:hypothetical protein
VKPLISVHGGVNTGGQLRLMLPWILTTFRVKQIVLLAARSFLSKFDKRPAYLLAHSLSTFPSLADIPLTTYKVENDRATIFPVS